MDLKSPVIRPGRLLAAAVLLGGCAGAAFGADIRLPDGPGANLVYSRCQTCHDLQYVVDAKGLLPSQWSAVLASMHDYGLQMNAADTQQVLQYLTTYLGSGAAPAPAPAASASASASASTSSAGQPVAAADGRGIYAQNCASCHGADGHGQAGYYPPLAGNPDLSKARVFPVLVVLNGLSGPVDVEGRTYDSSMPSFAHLSDGDIAAVVNFVRSWGDRTRPADPVIADTVARQREQRMTPADVHAYRSSMK